MIPAHPPSSVLGCRLGGTTVGVAGVGTGGGAVRYYLQYVQRSGWLVSVTVRLDPGRQSHALQITEGLATAEILQSDPLFVQHAV